MEFRMKGSHNLLLVLTLMSSLISILGSSDFYYDYYKNDPEKLTMIREMYSHCSIELVIKLCRCLGAIYGYSNPNKYISRPLEDIDEETVYPGTDFQFKTATIPCVHLLNYNDSFHLAITNDLRTFFKVSSRDRRNGYITVEKSKNITQNSSDTNCQEANNILNELQTKYWAVK